MSGEQRAAAPPVLLAAGDGAAELPRGHPAAPHPAWEQGSAQGLVRKGLLGKWNTNGLLEWPSSSCLSPQRLGDAFRLCCFDRACPRRAGINWGNSKAPWAGGSKPPGGEKSF